MTVDLVMALTASPLWWCC